LNARPAPGQENEKFPQIEPVSAAEVCAAIQRERPAVLCMPHVETSTGIILSDEYMAAVAHAAHDVGALVIVDGIAAGTVWLDMKKVCMRCV
jgi:alanine-glyoxylate transaminase/serine-glyoxylate transaminase/serine-pyruvate transaminase